MPNTSITKASPGQQGFTLIEIIAVLVILGILAAVATPRFFDLQDEARIKALDGAFSAGASQLSMDYAEDVLKTSMKVPDGTNESRNWDGDTSTVTLGDFEATLTYQCGEGDAKVELKDGPDWFDDVTSDALDKTFTICEDD